MRKPCPHGFILPRGLKCDRGYLFIRLFTDQGPYNRGCGLHTPANEKAARLVLEDIRIKQKLGNFNIPSKTERMRFETAWPIFYQKHYEEYRDDKSNKPRSEVCKGSARSNLRALNGFFGTYYMDIISIKALLSYRKKRIEYDGVVAGTVNKDMAILCSMLNMFRFWVEADIISPVKLPVNKDGAAYNPCELLPDLTENPREINYDYKDAITRLYKASLEIKDPGIWAIVETELDTTLRKNDLQTYFAVEKKDGYVTLTQSKTGTKVTLPEMKHPDWANVFVNFDRRWDNLRRAAGYPQMWFRDLRKIGMRLLEEAGFSPEDIATTAGHSNSTVTKKWYLSGRFQADKNRPLIEARRLIIQELKAKSLC